MGQGCMWGVGLGGERKGFGPGFFPTFATASDPRDTMLEHCLIALLAVLCPRLLPLHSLPGRQRARRASQGAAGCGPPVPRGWLPLLCHSKPARASKNGAMA